MLSFLLTSRAKVKVNKYQLLRLSERIEHIVVALDESRIRDIIRSDEYNDVLPPIFEYGSSSFQKCLNCICQLGVLDSFITRAQRLAQRLLKPNLGDRTWNAGKISTELRRLNDDVSNYLTVHILPLIPVSEPITPTQPSFITLKYILITAIVVTLAAILGKSYASSRNAQACTFLPNVSILRNIA